MTLHGEIDVIGRDSIKIPLHRNHHPRHIEVKFKHQPHPHPPCDHHRPDELEWSCSQKSPTSPHLRDRDGDDDDRHSREHDSRETFHLTIWWDVSSIRTIEWEVRW